MPNKPKSWKQKMAAKPPHTVTLDKDFAGVPAGAKLLISCPVEVERYLRQHLITQLAPRSAYWAHRLIRIYQTGHVAQCHPFPERSLPA
jgi:hypothetical protein